LAGLLFGGLGNSLLLVELTALSGLTGAGTPSSAPATASSVQLSGLGQLMSALDTFQSNVLPVWQNTLQNANSTSSSNPAVASASADSSANPGSYNLAVTQLAQSQAVESGAFADSNITSQGSGKLTIQLGSYNAVGNTFTASGSAITTASTSTGTLNDIASLINQADAGVQAIVVQDNAGYHLAVIGNQTGSTNAFKITAQDSDGNNTDNSGLSQFAYDPTAAAGAGKNLTLQQTAQSASYSIDGIVNTSASNSNAQLATGVLGNFVGTGATTITVSGDSASINQNAQNLTKAFNGLQASVNNLTQPNAPLYNEPLATALSNNLNSFALAVFSNGSSNLTTLVQIGFNFHAALGLQSVGTPVGSFTLDSDTLQAALNSDPHGVRTLLNQVSQSWLNLSDSYAGPGGLIANTTDSLQRGSSVLSTIGVPSNSTTTSGLSLNPQQTAAIRLYAQILALTSASSLNQGIIAGLSSGNSALSLFA
jgi:flagellar hook-associated protein 2